MKNIIHTLLPILALLSPFSLAAPAPAADAAAAVSATCTTTLSASIAAPSVAEGYTARLVVNGLTTPRGIVFDSAGHLLVVQSGVGVLALTFDAQAGACVTAASNKTVLSVASLNHGIALSADGKTLYVSDSNQVYGYAYAASTASVSGSANVLITNMTNDDHVTRTLYLSKFVPNTLVVARGSGANLDPLSAILSNGRAQVRSFNLSAITSTVQYTSGTMLGWGLRNDVGLTEHPKTGGLFTVENSSDDITRNNVDIHESNPAEELNYLGTVAQPLQQNYGYPSCFAVWNKSTIPENSLLKVGTQFAIGTISPTNNDTLCKAYTVPAAVFHPHQAPLDIKFDGAGSKAYVSFHGSWDSVPAVGYKVSVVNFNSIGMPSVATNSHNAERAIFSNPNTPACASTTCVRPVGLAFDAAGRLFFSSDATGEVWVIVKDDGSF